MLITCKEILFKNTFFFLYLICSYSLNIQINKTYVYDVVLRHHRPKPDTDNCEKTESKWIPETDTDNSWHTMYITENLSEEKTSTRRTFECIGIWCDKSNYRWFGLPSSRVVTCSQSITIDPWTFKKKNLMRIRFFLNKLNT